MINVIIRKYQENDCEELAKLFYDTVHNVNCKDYTKEQLDVWATGEVNIQQWNTSFLAHESFVAVEGNKIVGFGDIEKTGYLNRLFIHKDYQNMGIASAIVKELEKYAEKTCICTIITEASITAKPFFGRLGYTLVKKQQVERIGISLTNYVMEKNILR